jgi:hypothetical protein
MAGTDRKRHDMKEILPSEAKDSLPPPPREVERDPRFLRRIEQARNSLRAGQGVNLDDIEIE